MEATNNEAPSRAAPRHGPGARDSEADGEGPGSCWRRQRSNAPKPTSGLWPLSLPSSARAAGKPIKPAKTVPTFRELGGAWTSGEQHALYPDPVPLKDTAVDDASRLDRYAYPIIGAKPINEVTLDDCEEIMRSIPESAQRSRRHIAGTIACVFWMAVYPCRYIEASPLPTGFESGGSRRQRSLSRRIGPMSPAPDPADSDRTGANATPGGRIEPKPGWSWRVSSSRPWPGR